MQHVQLRRARDERPRARPCEVRSRAESARTETHTTACQGTPRAHSFKQKFALRTAQTGTQALLSSRPLLHLVGDHPDLTSLHPDQTSESVSSVQLDEQFDMTTDLT